MTKAIRYEKQFTLSSKLKEDSEGFKLATQRMIERDTKEVVEACLTQAQAKYGVRFPDALVKVTVDKLDDKPSDCERFAICGEFDERMLIAPPEPPMLTMEDIEPRNNVKILKAILDEVFPNWKSVYDQANDGSDKTDSPFERIFSPGHIIKTKPVAFAPGILWPDPKIVKLES